MDEKELLPCPFCSGAMRIESNRDWHKLFGDHAEDCFLHGEEENMMVPATDDDKAWMIGAWNRRYPAAQPEAVAVVNQAMGGIEWLTPYKPEFEDRPLYFAQQAVQPELTEFGKRIVAAQAAILDSLPKQAAQPVDMTDEEFAEMKRSMLAAADSTIKNPQAAAAAIVKHMEEAGFKVAAIVVDGDKDGHVSGGE